MSTSQPPKCYLLRIPRELRDAIYAYYLSDDGYYHQPESNTLRHADRSAIDLALTLSCKQVAAEMIALPLKLNAVLRNSQNVSPNDSPKAAWASSFKNYYQIRSQKLLTMK
ncbi:unnamed protein product [Alternaria alternata]